MSAAYTTFGNFLLLKQRSQDGLGALWRAGEMERSGFKRIAWLRSFDEAGLDRTAISAEAALATQLAQTFRSSNVVRNSTAGAENGVPYLAWDYIPAQPLDQLLTRVAEEQFPVAIDNALLITEKLAAALAAGLGVEVRGEPLVHGFLIPQMVLVGNDGEAMVAGFGLSRGLLANLDRVAVQEMAAPYLAPEVLASASASRRSDVYSLGAILYQLLCGVPLPADPTARAAALERPMLAFEDGPVPDDVATIMRKALAPRPEERFGSAADLKRELEKLLYGGAYSPTTFNLALFMDRLYRQEIEEEDREIQREKTVDVTPFYRAPGEAAPKPEAAPPKAASRTGLYLAVGAVVVLLGVLIYVLLGRPQGGGTVDQAMIEQMVAAKFEEIKAKEAELEQQLQQARTRNEELQRQYDEQVKAASSGKRQISPEEQARLDEQRRQIERAREEQKQREAELARVQREREQAQRDAQARLTLAQQPTAVPTPRPAPPTQAPAAAPVATEAPAEVAAQPPVAEPAAEPAAQPAAVPAAPAVREGDLIDFTQLDSTPQVMVEERPEIPRTAVIAKVNASGIVILKVLVNERGSVDDVRVLRGFPVSRLGVDEACVDAARKYLFKPGVKDGVKVKTWTTITMQIKLGR